MSNNIINSIRTKSSQINKLNSIFGFFTERELAGCLEATMPYPNTPLNEIWKKIYLTLNRDFGSLGSILSGTEEHFLLRSKLSTFDDSKQLLFAEVCDIFWNGSELDKQIINDYLWETCIPNDKDRISSIQKQLGQLSAQTFSFEHELYDEVELMENGTIFIINYDTPANRLRIEKLCNFIDHISCNFTGPYICNHMNSDNSTYEKIVIESDILPQVFKRLSDDAQFAA